MNGILHLSFSATVKLAQGFQRMFELSNIAARNMDKAEYWKQAQVESAAIIEKAWERAAGAFDNADAGLPGMDKTAAKIREIKKELAAIDALEVDPAAQLSESAGTVDEEIVKIGDTWTGVNKQMSQDTKTTTSEFTDEWGRTWDELEADAGKSIDEILKGIEEIKKSAAEGAVIPITATEGHKEGGPIGMNVGGKVPGGWGGGDRISALLEPGEFVMRKEAVAKWGLGFMSGLNALKSNPVRMQSGGAVGGSQSLGHYTHTINFPGAAAPVTVQTDTQNTQAFISGLERMGRLAA